MVNVSIRDALQAAANSARSEDEAVIDLKVHELVSLTLYDIANGPDSKVRGSLVRATRAQKLIMNRLTGLRRPGTHPAARDNSAVKFIDLTEGVLES